MKMRTINAAYKLYWWEVMVISTLTPHLVATWPFHHIYFVLQIDRFTVWNFRNCIRNEILSKIFSLILLMGYRLVQHIMLCSNIVCSGSATSTHQNYGILKYLLWFIAEIKIYWEQRLLRVFHSRVEVLYEGGNFELQLCYLILGSTINRSLNIITRCGERKKNVVREKKMLFVTSNHIHSEYSVEKIVALIKKSDESS